MTLNSTLESINLHLNSPETNCWISQTENCGLRSKLTASLFWLTFYSFLDESQKPLAIEQLNLLNKSIRPISKKEINPIATQIGLIWQSFIEMIPGNYSIQLPIYWKNCLDKRIESSDLFKFQKAGGSISYEEIDQVKINAEAKIQFKWAEEGELEEDLQPFTLIGGEVISCSFFRLKNLNYAQKEDSNGYCWEMVSIPLKNGEEEEEEFASDQFVLNDQSGQVFIFSPPEEYCLDEKVFEIATEQFTLLKESWIESGLFQEGECLLPLLNGQLSTKIKEEDLGSFTSCFEGLAIDEGAYYGKILSENGRALEYDEKGGQISMYEFAEVTIYRSIPSPPEILNVNRPFMLCFVNEDRLAREIVPFIIRNPQRNLSYTVIDKASLFEVTSS